MITTLLTLFAVGLVALVLLGVTVAIVGAILGVVFGVVGFLLFKVLPLLLVGWLVLKLVERRGTRRRISAADREWLDG